MRTLQLTTVEEVRVSLGICVEVVLVVVNEGVASTRSEVGNGDVIGTMI